MFLIPVIGRVLIIVWMSKGREGMENPKQQVNYTLSIKVTVIMRDGIASQSFVAFHLHTIGRDKIGGNQEVIITKMESWNNPTTGMRINNLKGPRNRALPRRKD